MATADDARVSLWICFSLASMILLTRFIMQRVKHRWKFDASDYLIVASILIITARTLCNEYILRFNINAQCTPTNVTTCLRTIKILTLLARVLITTFYWLQSTLLLLFYLPFVSHIPWINHTIRLTWTLLLTTYVAVILATFLECRPLNLYWTQPTSHCSKAYTQLLLQTISNITIDLLLLLISLPLLRMQLRQFPRNLQLGALYSLGLACIVMSGVRLGYIYKDDSAQVTRGFWASVQSVVTALVANAGAMYGAGKVGWRQRGSVGRRESRLDGQVGGHGGWYGGAKDVGGEGGRVQYIELLTEPPWDAKGKG